MKPLTPAGQFVEQNLGKILSLFDLGVADINQDNWLDIYTVNHWHRQIILMNNQRGGFEDVLSQLQLDQSPEFPGLEAAITLPRIEEHGFYIYWRNKTLVICTHGLEDSSRVAGKVRVPATGKISRKDNFKLIGDSSETHDWQPWNVPMRTDLLTYQFVAEGNGQLEIQFPGGPTTQFHLDESLRLERIYVGARGVHPKSHEFILYLKDRHGMAWADFNADKHLDVFIVHGGFGGKLQSFVPGARDELFVNNGTSFQDGTAETGMVKNGCRGRQACWVDFDNDGLLDLYVTCARGEEPNQLFQQQKDGTFVNVAAERGLDISGDGKGVWLDADNDGDMDLFWANEAGFWLYRNESGFFGRELIASHASVGKLTVADYDNDGDLDIFASSSAGNALFINNGGGYTVIDPTSVGLPAASESANWVDYDNDGLTDLHLVPQGIYRQRPDGRFEATHIAEMKGFRQFHPAVTWVDLDNDGLRDLLIAVRDDNPPQPLRLWRQAVQSDYPTPDMEVWELMLYRNRLPTSNHWLQIDLIGSRGNPQAIGARVAVITSVRKQVQQVGQAEGSLFSQGHYRLYFGLGRQERVDALQIMWPDGKVQEIKEPEVDRLLLVEREQQTKSVHPKGRREVATHASVRSIQR